MSYAPSVLFAVTPTGEIEGEKQSRQQQKTIPVSSFSAVWPEPEPQTMATSLEIARP
jgi:hypothetical protein